MNLKQLNDPDYQSELSLLSMVVDCIVGRLSNRTRFSPSLFQYDDTREAFKLFCDTISNLAATDTAVFNWKTILSKLQFMDTASSLLAARALRWAMSNRGM